MHDVVQQARSALSAFLTHMGMDEDEWNRPTFDQARVAVKQCDAALAQQAATPLHEALADQRRRLGAEHDATLSELARVRSAAADEIASLTAQLAASRQAATPAPAGEPPLLGRWHHGEGNLCSGTLRIARADFDTNPTAEFRDKVLDWMVETLNSELRRAAAPPATPAAQPADEREARVDPWYGRPMPRADFLRAALGEIADSKSLTATPTQFYQHLQRIACRALTADAKAEQSEPAGEREAFEAWAAASQFDTHRDESDKYRDYHLATTRWAWLAWQARAALEGQG